MQTRKRGADLAVIVSDLHCGSDVALAPPSIESRAGNITTHGKNIHQAWLWNCWLSMGVQVEAITSNEPAVLIVNGDAIEGEHHRNNKELTEQEEPRQVTIAAQCLKRLLELCKTRYVVAGTESRKSFSAHIVIVADTSPTWLGYSASPEHGKC